MITKPLAAPADVFQFCHDDHNFHIGITKCRTRVTETNKVADNFKDRVRALRERSWRLLQTMIGLRDVILLARRLALHSVLKFFILRVCPRSKGGPSKDGLESPTGDRSRAGWCPITWQTCMMDPVRLHVGRVD